MLPVAVETGSPTQSGHATPQLQPGGPRSSRCSCCVPHALQRMMAGPYAFTPMVVDPWPVKAVPLDQRFVSGPSGGSRSIVTGEVPLIQRRSYSMRIPRLEPDGAGTTDARTPGHIVWG